ncbi:MAG: sigma-70 family RNA polymerase sigma factor [Anaerolineae bacterium]|nr:sigma-70 family RNA polymerase sigma factor [Anaerolineae bacterium]
MSLQPDGELIALSLSGDRNAFGELVVRYRAMVLGVAYRVCGDAALADDVAQETFVRVWDRLHTYRPGGSFRAWICRIASNLTIDALRRVKPAADIEQVELPAPGSQPEALALEQERARAVRTAIGALPEQVRVTLVLREYEGLSYDDIARALDVPMGTVRSRLSDARRRLREALAPYLEG